MYNTLSRNKTLSTALAYLAAMALCALLAACDVNVTLPSNIGGTSSGQCLSNCALGSGVHGVQVFVEPDSGEHVITDAIHSAQKSVWLEIYLLSDRNVIRALEEDANRGIDVRVMLEPHPFGGGRCQGPGDQPQLSIDARKRHTHLTKRISAIIATLFEMLPYLRTL